MKKFSHRHKEFVSVQQREQASAIVKKLQEYFRRSAIAEKLGLNPAYVTSAAAMTKQEGSWGWHYLCPHKAIRRILEWGAKQ